MRTENERLIYRLVRELTQSESIVEADEKCIGVSIASSEMRPYKDFSGVQFAHHCGSAIEATMSQKLKIQEKGCSRSIKVYSVL
jgi:hypothetical protein